MCLGFSREKVNKFVWNDFPIFFQDIKAASLRTLTSIVHLERTPKLSNIIDCTGTASYHGFLPVLVRNCIQAMIGKNEACLQLGVIFLHIYIVYCKILFIT